MAAVASRRYIFGKNSGSAGGGGMEKIAMTTPVRTEQPQKEVVTMTTPVRTELRRGGGTRAMKVSFVMPGKYTRKSLPKPLDNRVRVKALAAHRMAAIRFRGGSPDEVRHSRLGYV
ncbi:unnamed protein product [Discosporangium mesarthrocarpum]